jgi:hypothetical protein
MICGVLFIALPMQALAVTYTYNDCDYIVGDIPVVISVPHGGADYVAYPFTTHIGTLTGDAYTIQLATAIQIAFQNTYGKKPHVIISKLYRCYLDPCRDPGKHATDGYFYREQKLWDNHYYTITENGATYTKDIDSFINPCYNYEYYCPNSWNVWGTAQAQRAWYQFHYFIDLATQKIYDSNPNQKILYIDLHQQTNYSDTIELGYGIHADDFANLGNISKDETSLCHLLPASYTNAQLQAMLRGDSSFGGILENKYNANPSTYGSYGIYALPSPDHQTPPTGCNYEQQNYSNGGWNLYYHTVVSNRKDQTGYSYSDYDISSKSPHVYSFTSSPLDANEKISGLQIEMPNNRINSSTKRAYMAQLLVDTIKDFFYLYYGTW